MQFLCPANRVQSYNATGQPLFRLGKRVPEQKIQKKDKIGYALISAKCFNPYILLKCEIASKPFVLAA